MSSGNVVQIVGAVVDVEFPRGAIPKVHTALVSEEYDLTLEVQQQLGDGVVRTIAMGSTDGLRRGVPFSNTESPITVPVGTATLGRIMDVLGNPVDEAGPVETEERSPIHREAPAYADQSPSIEILETGIKVIDLIMPIAKGGKIGLFGGAGVGKITQVIGSTFDAEFPEDDLPQIYNAIECTIQHSDGAQRIVGEVQQHIGGSQVRCVALG